MGYWENKFRQYFQEESNKIFAYPIFSRFLFGQITAGIKRKKLNDKDCYFKNFFNLIEDLYKDLAKGYTASFFPTLISFEEAKNFYLSEEKRPNREELFYYLYLLSSGIYTNNGYIINLITTKEKGWESFRDHLKKEEGSLFINQKNQPPFNINGLKKDFLNKYLFSKVDFSFDSKNVFVFALINFFVVWWLKEKKSIKVVSFEDFSKKLEENSIEDNTTLILFDFGGREKKKVFFYPRVNKFIEKWYFEYLRTGEEKNIILSKFLSNFVIYDKQYRDLSKSYLDKFLYYLLRGQVNGEILDKLINLRISSNLKNERWYPISFADKFYEAID